MADSSLIVLHKKQKYQMITEAVKILYEDKLNDGCSKLTVTLLYGIKNIDNGDPIKFSYKGIGIFNGFIFKMEHGRDGELTVTAYDQLRYAKAKDSVAITSKDTTTTLVDRMIKYLGLTGGTLTDTKYKFSSQMELDKTWIDVIYTYIKETVRNTGKKYVLRDEYGKVCLRDIEKLKMDLIIGDESLCYDYTYGESIDDEFYNQVKVYAEIETKTKVNIDGKKKTQKNKTLEILMLSDKNSIKKYGTMQYFEDMSGANTKINKSKMQEMAKIMLADYNRVKKTFSVECLGIPEVRAGNVIKLMVKNVGADGNYIVDSVTHDFLPNHTMDIDFAEIYEKESGKSDINTKSVSRDLGSKISGSGSGSSGTTGNDNAGAAVGDNTVVDFAKSYIGRIKYVFGADNVAGGQADCSSFVQHCYKKYGISLGRSTNEQVQKGSKIEKVNLQPGDLVFFKGTYDNKHLYGVSHVGIYAGGGEFVHCSSSADVTISALSKPYYVSHYLMGRRVL